MRRLVVSLLVLVALLVVADRVTLWAAQRDVAERLQADAHLRSTPAVSIHGFPFLTQLISGNYDDVDVDLHGLDADGLRLSRLSVQVHGAHVSLADVISQTRSRIRVDRANAQLLVTYADLDAFARSRTGFAPSASLTRATVHGVSVAGGDEIVLHTSLGSVPITIAGLPFGIRLTSAKATQAGVVVSGVAAGLALRP
jgi:hypothetical protein